jgi:hypothetical protein
MPHPATSNLFCWLLDAAFSKPHPPDIQQNSHKSNQTENGFTIL